MNSSKHHLKTALIWI